MASNPVINFLHVASQAMTVAATDANDPIAIAGAQRFASVLATSPALTGSEPRAAAISDHFAGLGGTELADAFVAAAPLLQWEPSPRVNDDGTNIALSFVNNAVELGDLGVGVLALAPGAVYPDHHHPPSEVYVIVNGSADWRFGGSEHFVPLAPGDTLSNHPHDVHSVRAGDDPLVALWVLFD